jgi:hypothetical protein
MNYDIKGLPCASSRVIETESIAGMEAMELGESGDSPQDSEKEIGSASLRNCQLSCKLAGDFLRCLEHFSDFDQN